MQSSRQTYCTSHSHTMNNYGEYAAKLIDTKTQNERKTTRKSNASPVCVCQAQLSCVHRHMSLAACHRTCLSSTGRVSTCKSIVYLCYLCFCRQTQCVWAAIAMAMVAVRVSKQLSQSPCDLHQIVAQLF